MEEEILVDSSPKTDLEFDHKFKPKGAMAFFALLIVLCLVIWYSIYFLMLERV